MSSRTPWYLAAGSTHLRALIFSARPVTTASASIDGVEVTANMTYIGGTRSEACHDAHAHAHAHAPTLTLRPWSLLLHDAVRNRFGWLRGTQVFTSPEYTPSRSSSRRMTALDAPLSRTLLSMAHHLP